VIQRGFDANRRPYGAVAAYGLELRCSPTSLEAINRRPPALVVGERSVLAAKDRAMLPPSDARLKWLEANADRAEVQELIRREIVKGTVRVTPNTRGGVHIAAIRGTDRARARDCEH
jgi:hypothetical protein